MSKTWQGHALAGAIRRIYPDATLDSSDSDVWISPDNIPTVMQLLRDDHQFRFDLLSSVTAVDLISHFEVVYHLTSLPRNATAVIKSKCGFGRESPEIPSVVDIWRGAELQEREIWDLMGIIFQGHPNHKRIMLWEGFPGHPLRKDFATYEQSIVDDDQLRIPESVSEEYESRNTD